MTAALLHREPEPAAARFGRHSDIRLTMDVYGELGEDDLFREVPGRFPVPRMFAAAAAAAAPAAASATTA